MIERPIRPRFPLNAICLHCGNPYGHHGASDWQCPGKFEGGKWSTPDTRYVPADVVLREGDARG